MYSILAMPRGATLAALILASAVSPVAAESVAREAPAIAGGAERLAAAQLDERGAFRAEPQATAIAWFEAGRAEALLAALDDAGSHALPTSAQATAALRAAVVEAHATPERRDAVSARLTRAFLTYARAVNSGALEPKRLSKLILVEPRRPDPATLLRDAASAPDMAAYLASLAPQSAEYAALRRVYGELASGVATTDWGDTVPNGPTLHPGDSDPRLPTLRHRLAALGHDAGETDAPNRFDPAVAAAVKAFQGEYGLNQDGIVGPATRSALNTGPAFRLGQIAVNLERIRWLNHPLGERRIVVNLPAFTVTLYDGDAILFRERVVIGKDKEQTPEFSDEMEYLVLNPTWFVPRSIATEDLLPRLQKDPSVLAQRNMQLSRPDGGPLPEDVATHDWSSYTKADFPYRIRQRPSSSNALGLVKFMFPNPNNIYLHDTPQKHLFDRDRRAFSWGCVRVRNPLQLAEILLSAQMDDAKAFIDSTLARKSERYVNLDRHIPVHITYRTAWIDETGTLQFRSDVYGRDALVLDKLQEAGLTLAGG